MSVTIRLGDANPDVTRKEALRLLEEFLEEAGPLCGTDMSAVLSWGISHGSDRPRAAINRESFVAELPNSALATEKVSKPTASRGAGYIQNLELIPKGQRSRALLLSEAAAILGDLPLSFEDDSDDARKTRKSAAEDLKAQIEAGNYCVFQVPKGRKLIFDLDYVDERFRERFLIKPRKKT